ncbi:MAG: DNA-directed RNA polymerase subunit omega [Desulfatiglandales bacterium]
MARITVQDCLRMGYNKFALVHLAAKRVFQLKRGKEPLLSTSNREVVTALREIAAGKVRMKKRDNLLGTDLEKEPEVPEKGDNMRLNESEDLLDET